MNAARLLYDADCGFCTRSARWLVAHGCRAQVAPLQSVDLAASGVDEGRALREVPFVDGDGRVTYGADAVAAALRTCSWPYPLAAQLISLLPWLARPVYRWVAEHRHELPGGSSACALPPQR